MVNLSQIKTYFGIDDAQTSIRREILGGITTFVTLAYIIVVNPKILEAAGIPFGPSMVATILTGFLGTMLMGIYARRPFAIAPYMGQNAFVAFTLVKIMGIPWQTALGLTFISGLIFALLTLSHIRPWLVNAIPQQLKLAFSGGIGLFLSFIGLNISGLIRLGVPDAPVTLGYLNRPETLLAALGFILISLMMVRRLNGALLLGILGITGLGFLLGKVPLPPQWISMPPDIRPILGQLDLLGALNPALLPILLVFLVLIFVDTMGTLIGIAYKANFLDSQGRLPDVEKPMLCDSLATMAAATLGTTTAGAYIESIAGIEAGGRTGLTAVVTALLFLCALFFAPLFSSVPAFAYGPALVVVGMMMLSSLKDLDTGDLTELIPAFTTLVMICFTYNLGIGMAAGFIVYPLIKTLSGRSGDVAPGLWVLSALSLAFFIFYPY